MAVKEKIIRLEELPDILTAQHIADYLNISRATVYTMFQWTAANGGIPNFIVGESSKRVDKPDFVSWLANRKKANQS